MIGKMVRLIAAVMVTMPMLANAVEIIGNETRVELTSAPTLIGLGLSIQPVGIGSIEAVGPTAVFPVTGGTIDDITGELLVEHDGSGLTLSAGTTSLLLLNFLIDTENTQILGDAVTIAPDMGGDLQAAALNDIPLFNLDGLNLLLTGTAAGAIDTLFGVPGLTNFEIGTASLDVAAVPVPGAVWLFGSALSLLFARKRIGA